MVLLGHNGAGKTTLINLLLGFYTDTTQHPFLGDFELFLKKRAINLGRYAYAPETALMEYELNALDYFRLTASIHGTKDYDPGTLMTRVSLEVDPKKPIKHYSKGMRQRLMLALALMSDPETIILDEPTSGLDPYAKAAIEELILELARDHRLVLSTHSLDLAARLGDEVCILRHGKIVFEGRVEERQILDTLMLRYRPEKIL